MRVNMLRHWTAIGLVGWSLVACPGEDSRKKEEPVSSPAKTEAAPVREQPAAPANEAVPGPDSPRPATPPTGMVLVPAGSFWRGCNEKVDLECDVDEYPGRRVLLDGFFIDRSEVTVGSFLKCIQAGKCTEPAADAGCNHLDAQRRNHPVNCVTWQQARTFCEWAGKRLPTDAEWEKAARGPAGRKFPWGDDWAGCEQAIMNDEGAGCGRGGTWPVCSRRDGNSPYGLCDMAGNVREWTHDWYQSSYYAKATQDNPVGPDRGKERCQRGGAFDSDPWLVRTSVRGFRPPEAHGATIGFRCAKSLPR